jgi:hypothetical protein
MTLTGRGDPAQISMWVTIAHGVPEYVDNRGVGWLEIIGRMKPGMTPEARVPIWRFHWTIIRIRI